jgi:mRNA-degrading endonuclease RelE of RelBE toxin-antitoxin system
MKSACLLGMFLFLSTTSIYAQEEKTSESKEAAYIRTINSRAQKIVATLGIQDSSKFYRVQSIIAAQYKNLNDLHTSRDEAVKAVKATTLEKEASETAIKKLQDNTAGKIAKLHQEYISQLADELSEEQIAKVKDGMTYNVVNITYSGYLDMLPKLTNEQKSQIKAWLVEAREYAMDAETSEKKHGWFGKYKGRINNYLSAAGYDLKKEGEAWQQRIKEREEKKNASKN